MSSARSGKGSHEDVTAGSRDERNLLVTVVAKVAKALQPSLVVIENVPAFFSRKVRHPRDRRPVSAANLLIADLSSDYVVFPLVTDLSAFGVPQSRHRAFLTFVRRDVPGLESLKQNGRAPYPRPTHAQLSGPRAPVSITTALARFKLPVLDASTAKRASAPSFAGFHSVPIWDARTYAMVAAIPKGSGRSAWDNQVCANCGPVTVGARAALCPLCRKPLLRPVVREANGRHRLVRGFGSSYRRMHPHKPAATITTASGHLGSDYTIHPSQNRLLSPLECALIQTFPRSFVWGNALAKVGHTNVREMIGEAVPPHFTQRHGAALRAVLDPRRRAALIRQKDERCMRGWRKLGQAAEKDNRRDPLSLGGPDSQRRGRREPAACCTPRPARVSARSSISRVRSMSASAHSHSHTVSTRQPSSRRSTTRRASRSRLR
jgi:DNA (cytosine-5)-methyltransferase 1